MSRSQAAGRFFAQRFLPGTATGAAVGVAECAATAGDFFSNDGAKLGLLRWRTSSADSPYVPQEAHPVRCAEAS